MWTSEYGVAWPKPLKFAICIVFDLFDMTFGRIMLGVGTLSDLISTGIVVFLWGPTGLLSIFEALDVTEQIDGFIPSNTIVAMIASKRQNN